jgi:hypothetical protein
MRHTPLSFFGNDVFTYLISVILMHVMSIALLCLREQMAINGRASNRTDNGVGGGGGAGENVSNWNQERTANK